MITVLLYHHKYYYVLLYHCYVIMDVLLLCQFDFLIPQLCLKVWLNKILRFYFRIQEITEFPQNVCIFTRAQSFNITEMYVASARRD